MKIYVTSQQRESLYQSNPSDPYQAWVAMQNAAGILIPRPAHDQREEILVTTDVGLLALGMEFDPEPSSDPAPASAPALPGDETQ